MAGLTHPRGDTLSLLGTWSENGTPTDLTGWTVRSQVRTQTDDLVGELTITLANQLTAPGQFTLAATAAQTAAWPVKVLRCDVEFTDPDGVVSSSDVFSLSILADMTR